MANNLKDHLKEVADAIRAKKGTSNLINPQDFATEIEGISGSGEGDGSNWRYFDISAIDTSVQDAKDFVQNSLLALWAICIIKESETYFPGSSALGYSYMAEQNYKVHRVGFDGAQKTLSFITGKVVSCEELYNTMIAPQLANWGGVEITKEQFYDLNA